MHKIYSCSDVFLEFLGNILVYIGVTSWRPCPPKDVRLDGQTVVITGGNKGIGKYVSIDCAERGARVIIACRDVKAGDKLVKEIRMRTPTASVVVKALDLSSLASIKSFAKLIVREEPRIDVLVNNAGLMLGKKTISEETGWEMMMTVNYFGLVYLTMQLLSKMKQSSPDPRVLSVSSIAHSMVRSISWDDLAFTYLPKLDFPTSTPYCQSKQAVILFSRELAKRNPWLRVYAVDPGTSITGLFDTLPSFMQRVLKSKYTDPFFRTIAGSAESVVYAVLHPKEEYDASNNFLYDGYVKNPALAARRPENQRKAWEETARLLHLESDMLN